MPPDFRDVVVVRRDGQGDWVISSQRFAITSMIDGT